MMRGVRRVTAAVVVAIGTLGSAGVVAVATAAPSGAQLPCGDSWTGPTTGTTSWSASAADWSDGFPSSSTVACIGEAGTYTVDFTGSDAPEAVEVGDATSGVQTLEVEAVNLSTTEADEVEAGGVLDLAPSSSGDADISSPGLTVDTGGGLTSTGSSGVADLAAPLTNQGTVTLGATTNEIGADATNQGSFTVSSGATLSFSGSTFTDASGTLDVAGSFDAGNTFVQSGATESGNATNVTGTLVDSAGTGMFTATGGGGIEGTIPVGQTVTVLGSNEVVGTSSIGLTDDGTLAIDPTSGSYAGISANSTSPGLTVAVGGTLTSTGTSNSAQINAALTNQGTVTLGATTDLDTGATVNEGTFTVSSGATLNAGALPYFTDASGTLDVGGTLDAGNVFTQSGATETGNPVVLTGTLVDSAGTGSFVMHGGSLEGTIPVGQTVTNVGSNVVIGTSTSTLDLTVDGSLICETGSTYCGFSPFTTGAVITVASGGTLLTTGVGNTSGLNVQLGTDIDVQTGGTMTVANADTLFNGVAVLLTDAGTLQVTATGNLDVQGSNSVSSTGTIGVTVGSDVVYPLGTIQSGAGFGATGTLAVDTVGAEGGGPEDPVITDLNGLNTAFTSFSFGSGYYTVAYVRNSADAITEVEVNPGTAFSSSPTPFSAAENESSTPQVASFSTNDEPGTYSATVDYGDGTGTQAATVALSGESGTVTGPTHAYTTPGSYTVTVVISTTAGTTETVTESVNVTGPTITGLSKTTVKPKKSLTVIVSGTDFDGTGTFSTSDPTNLTVVSVKFKPAKKKKAATYRVKLKAAVTAPSESVGLTLTQTGSESGRVTRADAITIS